MIRRFFALSVMVLAFLQAPSARAEDVWVLSGGIGTPLYDCPRLNWDARIAFYNPSSVPAEIRLLGVTNGEIQDGTPRTLEVRPHEAASAYRLEGLFWYPIHSPIEEPRIYLLHLDVPRGLVVESRLEASAPRCEDPLDTLPPLRIQPDRGKAELPVFRALVPAGRTQLHLGADVGVMPARTNVAIYNGGESMATAIVQVHRACDKSVVGALTFTVPPNTLIQRRVVDDQRACAEQEGLRVDPWVFYVTVTVDQPSLSIVSTLANTAGGLAPISISGGTPVP
jgi:hypothetical protein